MIKNPSVYRVQQGEWFLREKIQIKNYSLNRKKKN